MDLISLMILFRRLACVFHMLCLDGLTHHLVFGSPPNLLILVLNIFLRSGSANGIGISGNDQGWVGTVIGIDIFETSVGCTRC